MLVENLKEIDQHLGGRIILKCIAYKKNNLSYIMTQN
jgi:hypothetical protein